MYRIIGLIVLVSGSCLFKAVTNSIYSKHLKTIEEEKGSHRHFFRSQESHRHSFRSLDIDTAGDEEACDDGPEGKVPLILYGIGVLYMFVAIAIICDEFFVPALEELASEKYLNLSMDVAGATLMAAGGSAPELFTSLIGTFKESEVGFGTIVGSAVFNVLFVIGMCAVFSKDVLTLTWWPLARDCAYYSLGLLVLAFFCGVSSPGEIEMWEAGVLFFLYIGYVILMKYNSSIWERVQKKFESKVSSEKVIKTERSAGTFRAGLLNMFMGKGTLLERVGIAMVTQISGDAEAVFKVLDQSGDGFIDDVEFHRLLALLGTKVPDDEIRKTLEELDDNKDGKVSSAHT